MAVRTLVAWVLVAVVASTTAVGAVVTPPRISLSAREAEAGDAIAVRALRLNGPVRVYLAPLASAPGLRSRFDPQLRFIAALGPIRAVRTITVPPLEPGPYGLAYWCTRCAPNGRRIAAPRRLALRVVPPAVAGCPVTAPNEDAPPKVPRSTWAFHGNGELAVLVPSSEPLTTNSRGGYKMFWVARSGLAGLFRVSYRRLDPVSSWIRAATVTGTLSGFEGPSWASRMTLEPGCWQFEGRVSDVALGFVAEVVRGSG